MEGNAVIESHDENIPDSAFGESNDAPAEENLPSLEAEPAEQEPQAEVEWQTESEENSEAEAWDPESNNWDGGESTEENNWDGGEATTEDNQWQPGEEQAQDWQAEPAENASAEDVIEAAEGSGDYGDFLMDEMNAEDQGGEAADSSMESFEPAEVEEEVSYEEPAGEVEEAQFEEIDLDTPIGAQSDDYQEEEPAEEQEEVDMFASDQVSSEDPIGDIESFANSEESMNFEGPLAYDLVISQIDTAEMRTMVQEALDDRRFIWDIKEVVAAIEGGVLYLTGLNPVKASIIISRLKTMDVKFQWRQSAVNVE